MQGRRFRRRKSMGSSNDNNMVGSHSSSGHAVASASMDTTTSLASASPNNNNMRIADDSAVMMRGGGGGATTPTITTPTRTTGTRTSDNNNNNNNNFMTTMPENFVTQPPKPAKGLTGKISTLFRRESSRERSTSAAAAAAASAVAAMNDNHNSSNSPNNNNNNRRSPIRRSRSADKAATVTGSAAAAAYNRFKRNAASSSSSTPATAVAAANAAATAPTLMVKSKRANSKKPAGKRIFYSSNQDDDSDDSYESRNSRKQRGGARGRGASSSSHDRTEHTNDDDESDADYTRSVATGDEYSSNYTNNDMSRDDTSHNNSVKVIKRYRGFSTSIQSLFLDESLVCGSFGCFGLILSNRTEYLLQLRNERRGAVSGRTTSSSSDRKNKKIMPSRVIASGLVLTLLLMFATFVIWGFGTGNGIVGDYLEGYDYYDESQNGRQQDQWDDYLYSSNNGYTTDDAYYNKNNNNNNDDANNNNDDGAAAADDAANDDGNGRRHRRVVDQQPQQQQIMVIPHRPHGIFKIRDYQETIWDPIAAMLRNEWYRDEEEEKKHDDDVVAVVNMQKSHSRRREDEESDDATSDQGADASSSSSSSSSSSQKNSSSYKGYRKRRDLASDIRIALLFAFLIFLGILGRRRRMRTRFYLVRARAQEDHLYYASSDEAAARRVAFDDTREDKYEGACGHTLCGCYPVDEVEMDQEDENVEVADSGIFKRKRKPHHEDIVARSFNCFMASCCGVLCKCWFQCLSICALAQEAREVRLLLPPRYQRIDYITHQPFHEYQEAVNDLRRGWLGKARRVSGIIPHYNALSRLSRYILILSLVVNITIVATLVFNPRAAFSWQDAVVLLATFLQSFLVLFFVHWIFHKSDLSLDAVIKMFAAGFLIAVPTAFFFEGLLVNVALFTTWIMYDALASAIGDNFTLWVYDHWRAIWILGELFNAYIVAAVTEELCKYYTFRAVEHPDLVFLTGLQRESQEETAMDGGLVKYPFASHQIQELARGRSFADDASVSSHRSSRSHRSRSRTRSKRREVLLERTGTTDAEYDEDELDARTRRQKAMAITTGMISVAVGLACAENFLYVFVLGGALGESDTNDSHRGDLLEAWIVLFFRSIFPVHALAAAMQSINMIRKFVEFDEHNGHRVGVGRIILPAVILHGSFDAILMGINVFVETAWDNYLEENDGKVGDTEPYNALIVNLVAWISITGIMIAGLLWYYRENRKQRARLKVLEEQDKAVQAEQWISGANSRDNEEGIV